MKKKKNKTNILATIFITIGLALFSVNAIQTYMKNKEIEKVKQDFMNSLQDPDIPEDEGNGEVEMGKNIWGLLTIESVGIDLPVATGGNFKSLYNSLIAYETDVLPPDKGNFVVAGHNGSCPVCTFRYLHDVNIGDEVFLQSKKQTMKYEIYDSFFVMNDDLWVLDPIEDESTLTLLTCRYSSWTNPERLIVRARLVEVIDN